jgi:hypothetical protein
VAGFEALRAGLPTLVYDAHQPARLLELGPRPAPPAGCIAVVMLGSAVVPPSSWSILRLLLHVQPERTPVTTPSTFVGFLPAHITAVTR